MIPFPLFLWPSRVIFAFLVGFFYWRRLKNDYPSSSLLWLYFFTLFGFTVFPLFANLVLHRFSLPAIPQELTYWFGASLGFFLASRLFRKEKINFWEIADYLWLTLAALVILNTLVHILFSLLSFHLPLAQIVLLGWWLLIWGFSFWLSFTFRQLAWYKSGKVGLSATLGPAVYLIGSAFLAFFLPPQLYWDQTGSKTTYFFLPLALALFVITIQRAQLQLKISLNQTLLDIKTKISQIKTHVQGQPVQKRQ